MHAPLKRGSHLAAQQLAQFNIARLIAPFAAPCLADLRARLDEINALAERAPGFVWRWQPACDLHAPLPRRRARTRMMCTLSVWADRDSLRRFVYASAHAELLRTRRAWFRPMQGAQIVLWWLPAGARPSVAEGQHRLAQLRARGPSPLAFTLSHPFAEDAL